VSAIELDGVEKSYGKRKVLSGLDLGVEPGTFLVVLGPPACGKSVLVRLLTGLEAPGAGSVRLRGQDAAGRSPAERDIGYVPQSFALYPHYSVHDNIAYPLALVRMARGEIEPKVRRIAEQLKIAHLLAKRPSQLSGGEKQRVALARGLVKPTDLYVLDDPLTGLDFKLREQLFDDLKRMQQELRATFVYMTSDPLEALALADRVAILDGGRVVSVGPIEDVYRRPDHLRTMELLGVPPANRLAGVLRLRGGRAWCEAQLFQFPVEAAGPGVALGDGRPVQVGIRPQDVELEPGARPGLLSCRAEVILEEDLGAEVVVFLRVGPTPLVTVVSHRQRPAQLAETVNIGVAPPAAVVFAADSGERLGQGSVAHG
jgi:ABC-type sugar transport system ATPase subunit